MLWQEGPGGAATCPEMGRLLSAGQGHAGSAPLPAGPRSEEQDGGAGTHDGERHRKYHPDRGLESAPHRKAPFDAVVLKRSIEVGTLVGAGTVAFTLADTTALKAVFGVPALLVANRQRCMV